MIKQIKLYKFLFAKKPLIRKTNKRFSTIFYMEIISIIAQNFAMLLSQFRHSARFHDKTIQDRGTF